VRANHVVDGLRVGAHVPDCTDSRLTTSLSDFLLTSPPGRLLLVRPEGSSRCADAARQLRRERESPPAYRGRRMDSGRIVRTRPLCPYPETVRYDSQGSLDEAQSFTCRQDGIGDSLLLGGLGERGC
jgi:hypothetical protein